MCCRNRHCRRNTCANQRRGSINYYHIPAQQCFPQNHQCCQGPKQINQEVVPVQQPQVPAKEIVPILQPILIPIPFPVQIPVQMQMQMPTQMQMPMSMQMPTTMQQQLCQQMQSLSGLGGLAVLGGYEGNGLATYGYSG